MARGKEKLVKRYERLIKNPNSKETYLDEANRKLSEDVRESDEGLGIEDEEEAGEEPSPEIEEELTREDKTDENEGD